MAKGKMRQRKGAWGINVKRNKKTGSVTFSLKAKKRTKKTKPLSSWDEKLYRKYKGWDKKQ